MANNRMYLRCRGCGAHLFLGKSNLGGFWYESYNDVPLEEKLNEFYEEHNYCGKPKETSIWYDEEAFPLPEDCDGCDGSFDIVYETTVGSGYPKNPKDLVEVVRCKDCKYDNMSTCPLCWIENHTLQFVNHDPDFYCGSGERRNNETK